MIRIHCDGLTEPRNPGGYCCWAWIATNEGGEVLDSARGCLGHGAGMTNNLAEYAAVGKALRWAEEQGHRGVLIRTDSQLVVRQVSGQYACRKEHLARLRDRVRELVRSIDARLEWVPREENESADALTRLAYQEARSVGRRVA